MWNIQKTGRHVSLYIFSAARSTIRSIYFSDEISLYGNTVVRFFLSSSNITIILLIWAATHSILQCVVWMLIMPVVQEVEDYHTVSTTADFYSLFSLLSDIGLKIAPFATVSVCAASVGTKLMVSFGHAIVDANISLDGMEYPLLRSQLIFISEKKHRFVIWCVVLAVMIAFLTLTIGKSALIWFLQEPKLLFLIGFTTISEIFYVFVTTWKGIPQSLRRNVVRALCFRLSLKDSKEEGKKLLTYVIDIWWEENLYHMRSLALAFFFLGALLFCFEKGAIRGITLSLIMLLLFGLPHIFLSVSLHAAISVTKICRSFKWLARHRDAFILVVIIGFPYQAIMTLTIFYFINYTPILLVLILNDVIFIAKAIDLVREFDVTEHGSVHWRNKKTGTLIPPYIACVLENAYEKKQRAPGIVSLAISFDMMKMQLVESNRIWKLKRIQVFPFGTLRRYRFNTEFYLYAFPRLLSLQNRGDLNGPVFRSARMILRVLLASTFVALLLLVAGIVVQACFPQLNSPPVRAWVSQDRNYLAFDHIVVGLSFIAKQMGMPTSLENFDGYRNSVPAAKWDPVRSTPGEDFYPQLCQREFYGTTTFELGILALIPYLYSELEMSGMLDFINQHLGSDWVLRRRHGNSCVSLGSDDEPSGWKGYIDVYSAERNLTVVAIRGTDLFSTKDFLVDVNLYFESILYQFAVSNVPGAIFTPLNLVEDIIRLASIPTKKKPSFLTIDELVKINGKHLPACQLNNYRRDFFADVYNHIAYISSRNTTSQILLTGHSMGGSIAAIVASQMHVKAVAFSAPGILLARKKFNLDVHAIHRYVTSIVSSNDFFPSIGHQGGEVHHIVCLVSTKETCHAMEFIVGTLWRSCSSIRERFHQIEDVL